MTDLPTECPFCGAELKDGFCENGDGLIDEAALADLEERLKED